MFENLSFSPKSAVRGALLLLALLLVFTSFEVINPSERAVLVTLGKVNPQVYGPGVQFKAPLISHFRTFDLAPHQLDIEVKVTENAAISKDNQSIGASSVAIWNYDSSKILEIVEKYPDTAKLEGIINNTIYEALKAEVGKYTIFELAQNAGKIANEVKRAANAKLAPYPIRLTQFNLTNWDWTDDFDARIKETVNAQQKVNEAKAVADRVEQEQRAKILIATAEANANVAKATGEKQAAELRAEAKRAEGRGIADYNQSIAQNLQTELEFRRLEIQKIEKVKWNGAYVPTYVPITAAGTLVNLPAGAAQLK